MKRKIFSSKSVVQQVHTSGPYALRRHTRTAVLAWASSAYCYLEPAAR